MRAACAAFVFGVVNTNACPTGSSKIIFEAACAVAAGLLGKKYSGGKTSSLYPSGCYLYTGSTPNSVGFNDHPTGGTTLLEAVSLLCAGAP